MKVTIKKPTKDELNKLGVSSWGIWEKDVSIFPWSYDEKETCYILEGNAEVKTPNGTVKFGKGNLVIFPKGLKCTWEIKEKIKKHYNFG